MQKKRSRRANSKEEDAPKEPKTVKRPAKRPRRMLGKLKALPEMPIDILHEIFSNLDASDLVHL